MEATTGDLRPQQLRVPGARVPSARGRLPWLPHSAEAKSSRRAFILERRALSMPGRYSATVMEPNLMAEHLTRSTRDGRPRGPLGLCPMRHA